MLFYTILRQSAAKSLALIALASTAATAEAADVNVADAKIEAGKLVITGTTAAPNTWVRLDGQTNSTFNVKSGADGAFGFSIVYHPGDCIVGLQKLASPTSLGEATDALVANCGPQGLVARGAWNGAANYRTNDLVTSLGSSWRAKRASLNKTPATSAADWEQFAAAGSPGPQGPAGPAGSGGGSFGGPLADTPIGPAGGDLTGNYPNPSIDTEAVTTTKLGLGAVTAARIAAGTINHVNIANGTIHGGLIGPDAINSSKVVDDSLTADDLAPNSVGTSEIQTDGVQALEIQDNAIDSGEIVDNSLFAVDLGSSSVRGSELGTIIKRSVISAAIAAGATGSALSTCLAGERVITGGNDGSLSAVVVASRDEGNGWRVFIRNNGGAATTVTTHAYCLQAS